jgi:hypothetical protein
MSESGFKKNKSWSASSSYEAHASIRRRKPKTKPRAFLLDLVDAEPAKPQSDDANPQSDDAKPKQVGKHKNFEQKNHDNIDPADDMADKKNSTRKYVMDAKYKMQGFFRKAFKVN